ncbi:hypothetical protein GCM10020001_056410 [Nonomuraea salmonea]
MIAPLVGPVMAKPVELTATASRMSHTLSMPSRAWTKMNSVAAQATSEPAMSSLRRSTASAMAPPHRPKTISGIRLAMPIRPTWNEDRVSSKTCWPTAMTVTWTPMLETAWPSQIRR